MTHINDDLKDLTFELTLSGRSQGFKIFYHINSLCQ